MHKNKEILIVGAGPSGLSMALFLSEFGYTPRIVDSKKEIGPHSKALAVNPRTLEILDKYQITKRFLSNGRRMTAMNIWKGHKLIYQLDMSRVKHKYPFMLIQPQKESEEILLDELRNRQINVEYSTAYKSLEVANSQYQVLLQGHNNTFESFDYIIGADGGGSLVREHLDIAYKGFKYDNIWELFDIELDTDLDKDQGHIRIFDEGAMIMIRLKENIWRVAGNMVSLLDYLPKETVTGNVYWESKFRIHHKVAKRLVGYNAAIIGDAAHLHSPAGARGMNLGIEDAYIASRLLYENRLHEYDKIRRPYLEKTVNRINNITMGMAGGSKKSRFFRNHMGFLRLFLSIGMPIARSFILGLNK